MYNSMKSFTGQDITQTKMYNLWDQRKMAHKIEKKNA